MGYRDNIYLKNSTEWKKLLNEAGIYELTLPQTIDKLPNGKELEWKAPDGKPTTTSYYYSNRDTKANILEVVEVFTNPKNSIKVIVCGKDKKLAMFSRNHVVEGWTGLRKPNRYSNEPHDIFDNIKKGTFIISKKRYYGSSDGVLAFITNEPTIKDAERILETLYGMDKERQKNSEFQWQNENTLETYGTVNLKEVLRQKVIFDRTLRKFKWIRRKDKWNLWNSVKARLSIKKTSQFLTVRAKALDGKTYFLKAPILTNPEEEKTVNWDEPSLYTMDYWLPFVYCKPSDNFWTLSKQNKTKVLVVEHFLRVFYKIPNANFEMGVNRRRVKITRKVSSKGSKLNYLNGNLVAWSSFEGKLRDFFLLGKPLTPQKVGMPQQKKKILSEEAEKLIEEGLNGTMEDLEGKLPFHLNIIYKERKWYLEIGGKEYYVKGGQTALKKIQSAIKGTAIVDHEKYGWGRNQTLLIKDRIAELVGDKSALEIILHVKRMGAMVKAMTGK